MSGPHRDRIMSQSSFSSSDSSCLDPSDSYARVGDAESCQHLVGRNKGEKKSSSRRCSLAVVSLVLSVVCFLVLLVLGVLFCNWAYFSDGVLGRSERVCMPCAQIAPNPLAESASSYPRGLDIHRDYEDGETKICCASTPAQYATLFKLILLRQEEVKKLADILGNGANGNENDVIGKKTDSAHLLVKPSTPRDGKWQTLQRWKSPVESPVSHVRGGLKFHNTTLLVQTEGLYFVYCQILFNQAPGEHPKAADPASSSLTRLASHYVKRSSLLYPATTGILLKGRHSRISGSDDRHSSYVGGLFFLHTGDQLFVQVSVPELVSHDDRASFFGLFRVGN